MERLTAIVPNGMAYLVKVKPNEQEVESPYPNTLKAIMESIQKLAEYENLDEQGLSIKIPCKIGDKVYYTGFGKVIEVEVIDFDYWISDGFGFVGHADFPNLSKTFFAFSQFGENLFTTKEAAEKSQKIPPCKVGDTVKATVLRPFDNHTVHITGEVIAIRKNKDNATIRVKYNGNRIIDFYDTDFGDTVFVIKESGSSGI